MQWPVAACCTPCRRDMRAVKRACTTCRRVPAEPDRRCAWSGHVPHRPETSLHGERTRSAPSGTSLHGEQTRSALAGSHSHAVHARSAAALHESARRACGIGRERTCSNACRPDCARCQTRLHGVQVRCWIMRDSCARRADAIQTLRIASVARAGPIYARRISPARCADPIHARSEHRVHVSSQAAARGGVGPRRARRPQAGGTLPRQPTPAGTPEDRLLRWPSIAVCWPAIV
jgi:hypothetical protein